MREADDHVGNLDAGVVDVVLHFDGHTAEAQHAGERVAERRIAEMADVRCLVGIDGRMLDDCLAAAVRPRRRRRGQPLAQERGPLEEEVQVAIWRGGDALDAVERAEVAGDLLGNDPRRLAQPSASSNATGVPRSPRSRLGGYSMASGGCADASSA